MKLLITSVGSLLGQNILDNIESRRNLIQVTGLDASPQNPRNFRCDSVYIVPETDSPEFEGAFTKIVEKENPDFILPGRDGDSIFLSDFKKNNPSLYHNKIPLGSSFIPRIVLDKYETYLFCKKNNLAFADSLLFSNQTKIDLLHDFIRKHGFPLLVKPAKGFGSNGVYFAINEEQLLELSREGEILIQEYLGDPERILKFKNEFKKGIPLFFQVPEKEQYAAQVIIDPNGGLSNVFITINSMVLGRAEQIKQIDNPDIEKLVISYSEVFFKNGWYGPLNLQLKQDKGGNWKVFELNSRLTGTSSARSLLGFDEFGKLAELFIPSFRIPNLSSNSKINGHVVKYLSDNLLLDENVDTLNRLKIWQKS
jgi:hypothetical protein